MPTILTRPEWVEQVMGVVGRGLEDDRVEVRVKAGQVLGGLLHCEFISAEGKNNLLVRSRN
jgi:hypothetical protein